MVFSSFKITYTKARRVRLEKFTRMVSTVKPVLMFTMASCPYCKEAQLWMEELTKENAKYQDIEINIVDETLQPSIAREYNYYYVPTFYIDGVKIHEGAATKDIIREVFEKACNE
jgi:thioredoxin 1